MRPPKGQLHRNCLWNGNEGPYPLSSPAVYLSQTPPPLPPYCCGDFPKGPSGSKLQGEQKSCSWFLIIQEWMDPVLKAQQPEASSSSSVSSVILYLELEAGRCYQLVPTFVSSVLSLPLFLQGTWRRQGASERPHPPKADYFQGPQICSADWQSMFLPKSRAEEENTTGAMLW